MRTPSPDLAEQLRRVVAALDSGDLTAGPLARAHLAGALSSLDASAGAFARHLDPEMGQSTLEEARERDDWRKGDAGQP